jgi:hypothetical protein
VITVTLRLKTTNPNNNSQGISKGAMFARARMRKAQRCTTRYAVMAKLRGARVVPLALLSKGCVATITRIAPSSGLDPHDGLGAALKGPIDGTADALGLKNDRDPRVKWVLEQERGAKGYYGVRIELGAAS